MNKCYYGIVTAFLGISCLGLPVLAQETQPRKPTVPLSSKTTVPRGQFRITPTRLQGSFLIEVNHAPLESLFQAIAGVANRKLIISDEAQQKLQKVIIIAYTTTPQTPDKAFASLSAFGFSWGKVGQDTYLLVPRAKSESEIASEAASRAKVEELLSPQLEHGPDEPQIAPPSARLYLLSPRPHKTDRKEAARYVEECSFLLSAL